MHEKLSKNYSKHCFDYEQTLEPVYYTYQESRDKKSTWPVPVDQWNFEGSEWYQIDPR